MAIPAPLTSAPGPVPSPSGASFSAGVVRWLLLLTCCLYLYAPSVERSGWALDDRETIEFNPLVGGERPAWLAFAQDYWHHRGDAGLYRPLVTLSLRWNDRLLGSSPSGFHRVNLMLHLLVVVWAGLGLARLDPRGSTPWFGLALFALHPIQSEAVVWIAGRSSSLCALLGLIPLVLFLSRRSDGPDTGWRFGLWAFVGTLLPLLVKEDGLAFAGVWWFLASPRVRDRRLGVTLGLALFLLLRYWALDGWGLDPSRAALGSMPLVERISVGLGVHGMGWASLIWPELALGEVAGTDGRWQILGLMYLLLLWAFWAVRFVYRSGETGPTRSTLAWQTGLCIALLPWLQWIPGPELFGPRFLYLPMLFAIPLLPTPRRGWLATWPVYAGLLLMFALWAKPEVREQSAGFESPEAFWVERTRHRPMDSRAWNGRANSVFASSPDDPERLRQARFFWMRSIELDSNYSRPHVGLAMLARMEGNDVMEENFLRAAIRISSNNPVAFANLGALHLRQGNHRQALTAYESATLLQPGRAAFWRGLARAHAGLGSEQEARVAIERALALDPSDPLTIQVRKSLDP